MKKILASSLLAALAFGGGLALAQMTPAPLVTFQVPLVQTVQPNDVFKDIVAGIPTVGNYGATAAQIAGVPGYVNGGAISGTATFTFGNTQTNYFASAAAAVTIAATTAANPSDGQRECILVTTSVPSITLTANTGQTVVSGTQTGVAGTPYCWTYQLSALTWYRSP